MVCNIFGVLSKFKKQFLVVGFGLGFSFTFGGIVFAETVELPKIRKIVVEGNKHIKADAIIKRLPYKEGALFDEDKTGDAIRSIYSLGHFDQIYVEKDSLNNNEIDLYVVVKERMLSDGFSFQGNEAIRGKTISEKLALDKVETIDEEAVKKMVVAIQNIYKEENYHLTKVSYEIIPNKDNPDKAKVVFIINEGKKAKIKRVNFVGNKCIPSRKLRTIVFVQEDWVLSILDEAGKFSEEALEMSKKRLEYYYRDFGYLMAKVIDAKVEFSKNESEITITFEVREGDLFNVHSVKAPGDEMFSEDELMPHIEIQPGQPYTQTRLVQSINNLKAMWGDLGYIYADVYPQIVPNEATKEVDITFHVEKGRKMFVNRINVTGNKVTKDRVIRRELAIEEGDLITSRKMNESQEGVEYLGFFERGGVNWHMHKITEDRVDLDLNVKEAKTGHLNFMATYGSDNGSPSRSVKGGIQCEKSNFMGNGWDIGGALQANVRKARKASFYFADPHIFDTDISWNINAYAEQEEYDQWTNVMPTPIERTLGGSTALGFSLAKWSRRMGLTVELGAEHIKNNHPQALPAQREYFQPIVDQKFQAGDLAWLGVDLGKDTRNHKVYPNRGYKLVLSTKTAFPGINHEFSFCKAELDWSWYTPLIGQDTLVMMLHAKGGIIDAIQSSKIIPYKELFHMGGQTTVRGFVWGSIGPAWYNGDPLGARKAFQFNTELIFPLLPDYSMKAHVFYDAGAGWDTPKNKIPNKSYIIRDTFNLRHSVGFGLNLVKPFPAKIDWGYKLDRNKKLGESASEFHISMNTAW